MCVWGGPTSANAWTDSPESARGILATFEGPTTFPPAERVEILDDAGGFLARVPKPPELPYEEAIFGAGLGEVALATDQRGDDGSRIIIHAGTLARATAPALVARLDGGATSAIGGSDRKYRREAAAKLLRLRRFVAGSGSVP